MRQSVTVDAGSSPLARGLPGRSRPRWCGPGIIPARAGFTRRPRRVPLGDRDHPRSRGVYRPRCLRSRRTRGSSPLARGLRMTEEENNEADGIIPARAGFTRSRSCASGAGRDHPRSRGVYGIPEDAIPEPDGSSPLARGLLREPDHQSPRRGIIPARAGFTRTGSRRSSRATDHPRSRGVYSRPPRRLPVQ